MKTALLPKIKYLLIASFLCFSLIGMAQTAPVLNKNATPVKPILPSLQFKNATPVKPIISKDQMLQLDKTAEIIKQNPEGRIKVIGHGAASKMEQQVSWGQVNVIIRYLVDKRGISPKRFIFDYGSEGNSSLVDLQFTNEEGPTTLPAPHPNLREF